MREIDAESALALVRLLVAQGAHVAFVARTARAVERTASETAACGIVGDIGRKEDIWRSRCKLQAISAGLMLSSTTHQALDLLHSYLLPTLNARNWKGHSQWTFGSVPFDQGPVRRSCRFRTSRFRGGRDQHLPATRQSVPMSGGVLTARARRRSATDGDLGRGGQSRRRLFLSIDPATWICRSTHWPGRMPIRGR